MWKKGRYLLYYYLIPRYVDCFLTLTHHSVNRNYFVEWLRWFIVSFNSRLTFMEAITYLSDLMVLQSWKAISWTEGTFQLKILKYPWLCLTGSQLESVMIKYWPFYIYSNTHYTNLLNYVRTFQWSHIIRINKPIYQLIF